MFSERNVALPAAQYPASEWVGERPRALLLLHFSLGQAAVAVVVVEYFILKIYQHSKQSSVLRKTFVIFPYGDRKPE